jgi:F-type H+-transporting ATPase subunit epsilon
MAETGKTIHLEVITPDVAVFNDDVDFVLVRALDGDLGIMPNHAPLIASLQIWPLTYTKGEEKHDIFIAGGFLEVKDNKITVIAPAAELPENIDLGRAEKAKSRAEGRLQKRADGIDVERAQLALSRAVERIQVAKHSSGKH